MAIDRFTLEAIPLQNITVLLCANAFLLNWVARYGVDSMILTERSQ